MAKVREALKYDIDAVYFGDDWGQQHGLQMGPGLWRKFILPQLKRMYAVVHEAGKFVMIHSCGDVDELFDDLIDIGLNSFNPFQPEVMDVYGLLPRYRGPLPSRRTLDTENAPLRQRERRAGRGSAAAGTRARGQLFFAPAHDVEGTLPLENMLAAIELVQRQPRFQGQST